MSAPIYATHPLSLTRDLYDPALDKPRISSGVPGRSPEQACALLRWLDRRYGTEPGSPLHHDGRCPLHPGY